jgi:hypothetical protein
LKNQWLGSLAYSKSARLAMLSIMRNAVFTKVVKYTHTMMAIISLLLDSIFKLSSKLVIVVYNIILEITMVIVTIIALLLDNIPA